MSRFITRIGEGDFPGEKRVIQTFVDPAGGRTFEVVGVDVGRFLRALGRGPHKDDVVSMEIGGDGLDRVLLRILIRLPFDSDVLVSIPVISGGEICLPSCASYSQRGPCRAGGTRAIDFSVAYATSVVARAVADARLIPESDSTAKIEILRGTTGNCGPSEGLEF